MSNVIIGELFLERHVSRLRCICSGMIQNSEKLRNGVQNACLDYIHSQSLKKKTDLQKRLFKKSMVGFRRDINVDYAVKMLIERLVNALRWMRYAFNRPVYTIKTYNRLKKIRDIPVAHIMIPIPDNPYLREY